ncbi:uncharacterized protein N7483_010286 [Penicillium malachiteum]|uniref:uncharacterized protein n=1 Tax=Penicillium malachiteum TaxID=1324776 RepID=UPI002546B274|nr:uncharacterized protein N7483_010286 [Penicillium malachiteum]KAJ5713105.1 hypothetical protein N7483_010286 [Penicillium malachiteum]
MSKVMPLLQDDVERAANLLRKRYKEGKSTDIQKIYRCITVDVISTSLFGSSEDLIGQNENDIYPSILAALDIFAKNLWLMKHIPILANIALNLPEKYSDILAPGYQSFRNQCQKWITMVKARREKGILQTDDGRDTMFDVLLEPNGEKNYQVPDMNSLIDEAFVFMLAGADSTAYTAAYATYYILTFKDVLFKLKIELSRIPRHENGRLDCKNIQSLPYLSCVVKESLRIASAVPGLLPRVVPPQGANFHGKFIPGGFTVSSTIRSISYNAELFPEPEKFKPERWIGEKGKELERWNVAFSKGPRACVGINLAYMEISIILATFFADFDLSLYKTDAKSMEWRDHGVARTRSNVRVNARPFRA